MQDQSSDVEARLIVLEQKVESLLSALGIKENLRSDIENEIDIPPVPHEEPAKFRLSNGALAPQLKREMTLSEPIKLLPLLAVICFALAGIFIVKLAIDSGWLTPERQWGLLTLFGLALSIFGLFFKSMERSYRSYIGAAGTIVLYLAAYSSSLYFSIVPPLVAQALAALVSLFCFALFKYFATEIFVLICTVGTYLSPVLLNKEADLTFNVAFFLIWAALFSRIATYFKNKNFLLLASYFGIGVFTQLNKGLISRDDLFLAMLVLVLQLILFATGVFTNTIKNRDPLTKGEAMAFLPLLLFFYANLYYFLNQYNPLLAPWISLGIAGFLFALYWRAKQIVPHLESHGLISSFFAVVVFHSGYMQLLPDQAKPWLLPLLLLVSYVGNNKVDFIYLSPIAKLLMLLIGGIEFISLCGRMVSQSNLINVVPAIFTIILGLVHYFKRDKEDLDKNFLVLGLVHVLAIISLYRLAFDFGTFGVSVAWGVYAVLVLGVGWFKHDSSLAKSSIVVLGISCLKALFYDANQASSITRIGSLILTGAVLYGAGYLFKKIDHWKQGEQ